MFTEYYGAVTGLSALLHLISTAFPYFGYYFVEKENEA